MASLTFKANSPKPERVELVPVKEYGNPIEAFSDNVYYCLSETTEVTRLNSASRQRLNSLSNAYALWPEKGDARIEQKRTIARRKLQKIGEELGARTDFRPGWVISVTDPSRDGFSGMMDIPNFTPREVGDWDAGAIKFRSKSDCQLAIDSLGDLTGYLFYSWAYAEEPDKGHKLVVPEFSLKSNGHPTSQD